MGGLSAPRDTRDWMQAVNRQLREVRQGMPVLVGQVVGEVHDEIIRDVHRTPDKPVELQLQTAIYTETVSSRRWARVMVDFPDVTKATDGTDIEVSQYELWGKDVTGGALTGSTSAVAGMAAPGLTLPGLAATPANKAIEATLVKDWVRLTTATISSLEKDGFLPGSIWAFRARAIGMGMATPGEWSDESVLQMVADDTPPAQPSQPILSVVRGTIQVRWDGLSVAGAMPGDFRYLEVAQGPASSPENIVTRFYRGGGLHVAAGFGYYVPQFFRFRAVDESGNKSPWSAQAVGYSTPMVDTDVILSTIDAAKTHLKNIDAGVSILPNSIITEHLVVTEEMTAALAAFLHVRAGMIEANAVEADSIAAGAVLASKLEADLALVTAIIAGNPLGTHAQMDQYGFRVFAEDPTDGIPNEVVRMGVATTSDYFAITRANGTLAATISQDGVASFTQVNATDALYYKGNEIGQFLSAGPRGPVYKGELSSDIDNVTTAYGLVEGEWISDGTDRQLLFKFGIHTYPTSGGSEVILELRYTTDGSSPRVDSALVLSVSLGNTSTVTYDQKNFEHSIRPTTMNPAFLTPGTRGRFLMVIKRGNGDTLRPRAGLSTYMYIDDIGKGIPHTPSFNPGGGSNPAPPPPVPVKQNYVQQWGANDSRSYTGGNAIYNYNTGQMYQGLSPAGYGNLKSIATFAGGSLGQWMVDALAGASINYVRVYFNFNHWYYNSGGTARIGLHGHTSIPGSFSSNGVVVDSGGWPKPGARWVDIPSQHWWGFQSGAYRGVSLEGDGGYGTYGYADRPTIEIGYTK